MENISGKLREGTAYHPGPYQRPPKDHQAKSDACRSRVRSNLKAILSQPEYVTRLHANDVDEKYIRMGQEGIENVPLDVVQKICGTLRISFMLMRMDDLTVVLHS